jgi:hypothetical protein
MPEEARSIRSKPSGDSGAFRSQLTQNRTCPNSGLPADRIGSWSNLWFGLRHRTWPNRRRPASLGHRMAIFGRGGTRQLGSPLGSGPAKDNRTTAVSPGRMLPTRIENTSVRPKRQAFGHGWVSPANHSVRQKTAGIFSRMGMVCQGEDRFAGKPWDCKGSERTSAETREYGLTHQGYACLILPWLKRETSSKSSTSWVRFCTWRSAGPDRKKIKLDSVD